MNVEKLKRVAIKEFKRSPAKTGILLAGIPVALYFCVPLLFGAAKKSSPAEGAATTAVATKQADFVLPAATKAVVAPSQAGPNWVEVARSLANDFFAMPTNVPANARNPFAAKTQVKKVELLAAVEEEEGESEPQAEPAPAESMDPSDLASNPIEALGLELNATMVGQRSRLATINGKTYKQGETIPVTIDSEMAAETDATLLLELAHVERQFVVLKMNGHQHRLQLRNEVPRDVIVVKSRPE